MMGMVERSKKILELKHYPHSSPFPELLEDWPSPALIPLNRQYVLRLALRTVGWDDLKIPGELSWLTTHLTLADTHQKVFFGNKYPFAYVTVRHGVVDSVTDDEWHVDGFSARIPHRPERNYIWSDHTPTQFLLRNFTFPEKFDPLVHDVNTYINSHSGGSTVFIPQERQWVLLDPYCPHRRSPHITGKQRTFVRITFTEIQIKDGRNTWNPLHGRRPMVGKNGPPPNDFKKTLKPFKE